MELEREYEIQEVLTDWYNLGEYYDAIKLDVMGVCQDCYEDDFNAIIEHIKDGFLFEYSSAYVRMQDEV